MFGDLEAREDLKQLIQLLNKALDTGDEDAAVKYAELLASKKVKCTVKVNTASQTRDGKNFCIKVHIEDKDNSGGIISLSVNPSDTILDLKTKMFHEHNFPTGIQHWVIGRALPRDEETLRRYNIVDGTVIYLYLSHVAADSAKTTHVDERLALTIMEKENSTIKAERSPKAQSSHSPNLPPPGTTPEAHALNQTMGQMSLNQSGGQGQNIDQRSKSAGVNDDQVEPLSDPETRPGMIEGAGPEVVTVGELGQIHFVQNKKRVGWTCPACTFVNLPSRPGCEICSTTRPLDYKVPESYVMTEEEKRRLQQEQESEQQTKTRHDQEQTSSSEDILGNLDENACHFLLQINDKVQEEESEYFEQITEIEDGVRYCGTAPPGQERQTIGEGSRILVGHSPQSEAEKNDDQASGSNQSMEDTYSVLQSGLGEGIVYHSDDTE